MIDQFRETLEEYNYKPTQVVRARDGVGLRWPGFDRHL